MNKRCDDFAKLRRQAEEMARERAAQSPEKIKALSPEETQQMFHELRVHQIELEIQNEELRQAQAELDATRAKYFDLYDQAPVGYVIVNEKGLILETNLAAATFLNVARASLVRQLFTRFILREDQDIYYLYRKRLMETDTPQACEFRMLRTGADPFWVRLEATTAKDADGKSVYRFLISDVTDRKRAEKQILTMNEELEQRVLQRTSELTKANEEMNSFNYSVAHDLRAPLRAIDGFTRMIQEDYTDQLGSEGKRLLDVVRANTKIMDQLIMGLLDLTRVSRTELQTIPINMSQLAYTVWEEVALPEVRKIFEFSVLSLPECSGDLVLIRQVWVNLLSNAIKYSLPKEVRKIEVGGYTVQDGMNIYYVKDAGIGFDPDNAQKLFCIFQRLHKVEDFEGTGIGLATVKRIVQRHGGKVWAEGQVNVGATFYFSLPKGEVRQDETK
jgi:PAS domain S-box-containing protein